MAMKENRLNVQGMYENFNSVSTFIENPFKGIPFSYVPTNNTEAAIRRDILFSYFSFYIDLKRLKSVFARPDQGVGWFNAGERLKETLKKVPSLAVLSMMMLLKFGQLFYYSVIGRETRISMGFFLKIFKGLFVGGERS